MAIAQLLSRTKELERYQSQSVARSPSVVIANDNVTNPPTDAELDTAFGDAATLPNGFVGLLDDNGAGSVVWFCAIVNDRWWYEQLTVAV